MDRPAHAQVAILGLGPAGRAAAHRLAAHGVDAVAVDRSPGRRWTPTYAAWVDELPEWLPPVVVRTRTSAPRAWAVRERVLDRAYAVLDTPGLQDALTLDGVRVVTGTVAAADDHTVRLIDGSWLSADVVLDARGSAPQPSQAQQTAVGVVVDTARAAPIEGPWFMDWRRDNGSGPDEVPSFLYAVPLDEEHVLLEETCLVGRPALGLDELHRRLRMRLASRGVTLTGDERVERVRFCVEAADHPERGSNAGGPDAAGPDAARPDDRGRQPRRIGSRAGLMHPASGYSVALSLSLADPLARAVRAGVDVDTILWPARARRTQALRRVGLTALLRLPPEGVEEFFAAFFALPVGLQRAYLSGRERPLATMAAMTAMVLRLRPALTRVAVGAALRR